MFFLSSIAVHLVSDTKFGDVIHGGKHVLLHRVPDVSVTDFLCFNSIFNDIRFTICAMVWELSVYC